MSGAKPTAKTEAALAEVLAAFCEEQSLPLMSADELLGRAGVSMAQNTWLAAFGDLWDATVDGAWA